MTNDQALLSPGLHFLPVFSDILAIVGAMFILPVLESIAFISLSSCLQSQS